MPTVSVTSLEVTLTASETLRVVRVPTTHSITVAGIGAQGPAGPPGASGDFSYDHTQSSASAQWIVNHNAGFRPDVEVRNSAGGVVGAEVLHVNVNQTWIMFSAPQIGSAHFG